ncbi:MAG: beta-cystathionase [Rubripirellula sp.]
MNFFKESSDQAREAFAAMPMQSRIISVMLVAAIVIGLAFLVRGDTSSKQTVLFGGQSFGEQELASMEMAFSNAGLNDWQREGRRIMIPSESKSEYLAALQDAASLPLALRSKVHEAFTATSIFESSDFRNAREMHAKEQDLGRKIALFPDVRWASVEYDRGERRGLSSTRPQSASVVVQPEGSFSLPRSRISTIQDMIRGSYAEMTVDDVVVIDTNSSTSSTALGDEDPVLRKQRETEARIEQKVRSLLIGFPAQIAVRAEIDPTMDHQKTILKFDADPTNLVTKQRKIETTNSTQPNQGVPGTAPNAIGNRSASIAESVETSKTKEDERESSGVAGQQYENSRMASLQVKSIRVSVLLPTSYYETVFTQDALKKNPDDPVPDFDDVELEKLRAKTERNIQDAITVLLPEVSAGASTDPLVVVNDYPDLPMPEVAGSDTGKMALTWLSESWQTIALIMLGLFALLVARSAAKGTGDSTPTEFREGFGLELPAPPPEPEVSEEDSDEMTITGGTLKQELVTIVEGNPEVAANVIRSWIGEAA